MDCWPMVPAHLWTSCRVFKKSLNPFVERKIPGHGLGKLKNGRIEGYFRYSLFGTGDK